MSITRAGLVAHFTLPAALAALSEAATWLEAHGCTPVVEAQSAEAARLTSRFTTAARDALPEQVDVVVAFGGDGTMLDAAGAVAHSASDVPLLGVNLGRLGFLTEVGRTELVAALDALIAGRTRTETRLMLSGCVERHGQPETRHLALNDIVVTRGALSRMVEIDVTSDGQVVSHVKADGVIVATATGSTAYNLSAGGPIVHPSVDAFVLTPIAPHTLTNRPLVLSAGVRLVLRPGADAPKAEVVVTFDGQYGVSLGPEHAVVITRAPRLLRLVRTSARTHFDMLREKLKWGN
jgi:NAD+ kinase